MPGRLPLRRGLFVVAVGTALLLGAGWLFQTLSERRDLRAHPRPGEMVDIGTHRLHMHSLGTGSPAVLLEAGLGNGILHWSKVHSELARFTTVHAYDRAGLGHSEEGPLPRSGEQVVDELERLIVAGDVEVPLVVVGHSNGALYARLLASRHPEWVAGMVFVDPSPENAPACEELPATTHWTYGALVALAPVGVPRILLPYLFPLGKSLPDDARAAFGALRARAAALRALWSEWESTCDLRVMAGQSGPVPPSIPVIVLSAKYPRPGAENASAQLHRELVEGIPGAELIVVEDSRHWIQLDRPDAVIEAVRRLIDR